MGFGYVLKEPFMEEKGEFDNDEDIFGFCSDDNYSARKHSKDLTRDNVTNEPSREENEDENKGDFL